MAKFKLQEACNRAKEALEHGDSERAIAMGQHIVRYYPRCVEAYRLLGEAYLERGDTATADKLFSYVVQADPQNVLAHIGRAIIREERGEIDAAISEFERAFEIDPAINELREELLRLYTSRFGSEGAKIRTSRVGLAHLYAHDYLFPQAINEYNDILHVQPRLDVRVALAMTLWRAGNDEAAADLCNAILQQVPNNIQANLILGQIWLAQGQRDDALALLRRAMDLDPDNALARSLFESRAGRIVLPPLTYYAAELPKWEGSELSASSELPVGLNEVVELEEDVPTPQMVAAASATAAPEREASPIELNAAVGDDQLTNAEREVEAEADVDQTPAWLLSEAPLVETSYPISNGQEDNHPPPPELQRQRLDRSEFLQRLATAGLGATATSPTSGEANVEAAASAEATITPTAASPDQLDVNSADWLEQLAANTRFDADAPLTSDADQPVSRERSFLDELLDNEEASAPAMITAEREATPSSLAQQIDALPASPPASTDIAPHQREISSTRTTGPLPNLAENQAEMAIDTAPTADQSPAPTEPDAVGVAATTAASITLPADITTTLPAKTSEEETMPAPSYAEDDEQGRTFEFDWDKEGLPDYLKEFALGESSNLGAAEPASASQAQPDEAEGLPSWLTSIQPAATTPPASSDEQLPSWLTSAPPAAAASIAATTPPTTPSTPLTSPSTPATVGPDHLAGLPNWLTSASPPDPPATTAQTAQDQQPSHDRNIDSEGLPSWLTSAQPEPPAAAQPLPSAQSVPPTPPATSLPPASEAASTAGMNDMDMEGLPIWLTATPQPFTVAPIPPNPPPVSATHNSDVTGLDSMDLDRVDMEGLPSWLTSTQPGPAAPPSPAATPPTPPYTPAKIDDRGLPLWPTPESTPLWLTPDSAPPPPSTSLPPVPSSLQPFTFADATLAPIGSGQLDLQSSSVPLDDQPAPPVQAAFGDLQPFNFDDVQFTPPGGQQPGATSAASPLNPQPFSQDATPPGDNLEELEDFVDFLKPATAAATQSPMTDIPSNLKPFSLDDLNPPISPAAPPTSSFDSAPRVQPFSLADSAAPPPAAAAQDYALPSSLKPFSLDDANLSAQTSAPPSAAVSDFGTLAATPPAAASGAALQGDFAIPADLKPFSYDDFGSLAGLMQEPPAAGANSAPLAPSTADHANYDLPADLQPFSTEADTLAQRAADNDFDFAPFNLDELMQESSTNPAMSPLSAEADTVPSRPIERSSMREADLEQSGSVDVRGFSWQQSTNRGPTAPLVQSNAEDDGVSMFAKLRRRKEELERNEPATADSVAAAPPLGAPLTDEERFDSDQFDLSELDLSPDERSYLLGEDTPISGLETMRQMQKETGTGDYLMSRESTTPNEQLETPAREPVAAEAVTEPEFADMYEAPAAEQSDILASAEAPTAEAEMVEGDYTIIDEQMVVATEMRSEAPPAEPAYSYVPPATPVVPPSAYVPPAPPSYMDSRAAAPAAMSKTTAPIAPAQSTSSTPGYAPTLPADELTSIAALRTFVDANRDDVTARLVLAHAYTDNEDYDNALEQYRLIIKNKSLPTPVLEDVVNNLQDLLNAEGLSNNPHAHRLLGDAYMKQGLFQHAISQYNWLLSK